MSSRRSSVIDCSISYQKIALHGSAYSHGTLQSGEEILKEIFPQATQVAFAYIAKGFSPTAACEKRIHYLERIVKYKLVIFDFDGTLADSFPWFIQVGNSVADVYHFKRVEAHELETLRGYSARQIVKHLGVSWWKLPLIGRHLRKMAADNIGKISLFDGVDRMLEVVRVLPVEVPVRDVE